MASVTEVSNDQHIEDAAELAVSETSVLLRHDKFQQISTVREYGSNEASESDDDLTYANGSGNGGSNDNEALPIGEEANSKSVIGIISVLLLGM